MLSCASLNTVHASFPPGPRPRYTDSALESCTASLQGTVTCPAPGRLLHLSSSPLKSPRRLSLRLTDDPAFQLTPKIKAAAKDFHNCPHHADPLAGLGPEDSGIFHTFPGQSRAVCTSKSSSSLVRHPPAESILEVLRTPSAPKLSCCGLSHSR